MNVLIVSDTHGYTERIEELVSRLLKNPPDAVFFLGDGMRDTARLEGLSRNFYSVPGNCDWGFAEPQEKLVLFGGKRILMLHGHTRGVKYGTERVEYLASELKADAVIYGHTHEREDRVSNGIHIFNPGSLGLPNRGAPSFGTLTVKDGIILFSHGEL